MKICMAGGGTGGSVTPLVAVAEEIKSQGGETEFLFIGGKEGPEKALAKRYKIKFKEIDGGKLRRYFSLQNFSDVIKTTKGYFQARNILKKEKPDLIISAGSYLAVPVTLAGKELGIKSFIHQQDYCRGLANRLMAPLASKVTVTFRKSLKDFPQKKTVLTGNPIRPELFNGTKEAARQAFKLEDMPTILVLGGGTGSQSINDLLAACADDICQIAQVIHLTGSGKKVKYKNKRCRSFPFLQEELKEAYSVADLVVTRAGMGVLSELSALEKPSVIIPYPNSHQEENAKMFADAALVFRQKSMNPQKLLGVIKELIPNHDKLKYLSETIAQVLPRNARKKIVKLMEDELK